MKKERNNNYIHNLKLQKILYFIQAYFLQEKECFSDKIWAWDCGPVALSVYQKHKKYLLLDIPMKVDFCDEVILMEDKKVIENIVDSLSEFSNTNLLKIIQKQNPWIDAYYNEKTKIISTMSTRKYFWTDNEK